MMQIRNWLTGFWKIILWKNYMPWTGMVFSFFIRIRKGYSV